MARIKRLKPNSNVRKFSIELEMFYDDKPIELAQLHDAVLHCFPELEELRVDINSQGMFGKYEDGDEKLDQLVERVNKTAQLCEASIGEWQKPRKVFLKHCFEIRCEHSASYSQYEDLPGPERFPGFQEDENARSNYVEDDDWGFGNNWYGASAAVCVKKRLDVSNDRRMALSCNISRYEVEDTECDDFSGYDYGYD
ncbi:hypothetical protein AAVH_33022 [Aphelenchoides avenae]|nr:hypothetical protein AAVH_33022 [Aphelenchus avenae]